jgi:uncharacterized protein
MKKVYIIHGWEGSPQEAIHKWLKLELESNDFEVSIPEMPNPDAPKIEPWVSKLKDIIKPDKDTYLIGHSIGCQTILRYLETLPTDSKVGGVILLAPWMHLDETTIQEEPDSIEIAKQWVETPIIWEKVKSHTSNFIAIFSDNDPYVPSSEKDLFEKNLRAKTILEHNKGHYNESDGVIEVPAVLEEILRIINN